MPDVCHATTRNRSVFVRTLHEACLLLGGEHQLAAFLGIDVELLNTWLEGDQRPPDAIFLRCVDLLQRADERGSGLTPPPEDDLS